MSRLRRFLRTIAGRLGVARPSQEAAHWRRARQKRAWQRKWNSGQFSRPWLGRVVSTEIVGAVEDGWFPAGAAALDIGCGEGDVAAWLAGKGFPSVGIDIAPAAIERARARHGGVALPLEFHTMDICLESPPDRQFRILVDRGCFHQIPSEDRPAYLRNVLRVSAPDVRLLLFKAAFRQGKGMDDEHERRRQIDFVLETLGAEFNLLRSKAAYIDANEGKAPAQALPGMAFWLERKALPSPP